MKRKTRNTGLIFIVMVMIAAQSFANFQRKIHRNWPVSEVLGLKIENQFGDINFVSSRTDSVTISIVVSMKNLPQNRAQYLSNQINFRFWITDGIVNARTDFGSEFKTNQDFSIEYTINIPEDKYIDVLNTYGNVSMGKLTSGGSLKIQHGNFQAHDLIAPENQSIKLDIEYGNADIIRMNNTNVTLSYTKLNVTQIENASISSNYSIISINRAENIAVQSQYDHYNIEKVDKLSANSSLTAWNINELKQWLELEILYGDFLVSSVDNNFGNIDINNQYGNIRIKIPDEANYYLESECYFCQNQYREGEVLELEKTDNLIQTKIKIGEQEAVSKIIVKSRYGSIILTP